MIKPKKIVRYFGIFVVLFAAFLLLQTCDSMNASHEKFTQQGEVVYTGKIDSVEIYPGNNRLEIEWLLMTDPKVSSARIYWNQRSDSMDVEIQQNPGVDTVSVKLDEMEEGSYTFEIITMDDEGNSSIPVTASGRVYGSVYENSLLNRPITSAKAKWEGGESTKLEWGSAESSAIGVQVTYMDTNDQSRTIFVPLDETTTELEDFKTGSEIEYQTMYLPEPTAIDTFYAKVETSDVIYEMPLKNTGYPVEYSSWDGDRWGMPRDWVVNDSVKIHDGYGGYDGYNGGGYFSMESWGGQPDIVNGKIYQSITLPAGTYSYEANFDDEGSAIAVDPAEGDTAYVVINEGNTIPDVWDVETEALRYSAFSPQVSLEFTLTEEKTITFGFSASFRDDSQAFRCHSVRLFKTE